MGLIGVQVNWIKMLDCEMTVFNCWPWSLSWQYTVPVNCWGNLTIEMQSNLPTVDLQSYIAIALDNIKATIQDQHLCIVSMYRNSCLKNEQAHLKILVEQQARI